MRTHQHYVSIEMRGQDTNTYTHTHTHVHTHTHTHTYQHYVSIRRRGQDRSAPKMTTEVAGQRVRQPSAFQVSTRWWMAVG